MIDILAFRQSYKRRKIAKIRWIHNRDNPANALTKATANSSLEQLVSTNKLVVRMEGHIKKPFARNKKRSVTIIRIIRTIGWFAIRKRKNCQCRFIYLDLQTIACVLYRAHQIANYVLIST
jgi:hypothetical protein